MEIRERKDGNRERLVVTAMVVSKEVVGAISTHWDEPLFASPWANLVGQWAVEHYREHSQPIGASLRYRVEEWAAGQSDDAVVSLLERFLDYLEDEFDRNDMPQAQFVLQTAERHFNSVRIEKRSAEVKSLLSTGRDADALELWANQEPIRITSHYGGDALLLGMREEMAKLFGGPDSEKLFGYPDAIGELLNPLFVRDGLVSIMAPDKTGKSTWLRDMAVMALAARCRVAYFEAGDSSETQVKRQFYGRVARRPIRSPSGWPLTVRQPTGIKKPAGDDFIPEVTTKEIIFDDPLDAAGAVKAVDRLIMQSIKSKTSYLKFCVHPNSTLSVSGIEELLKLWATVDSWVPDVVVIDYADILAPMPGSGRLDQRDKINETWKALRRVSQQYNCLVLTATQSNAEAYSSKLITRKNFSDDKRKLAHVTGMIGLCQTREEKQNQSMRVNIFLARDFEFNETWCVHVATCFPLGLPVVKSCWG